MGGKAMTLIELIISLAIAAVLAATVLLSFSMVDRKKLETEARNLAVDLSFARSLAVSRNEDYPVAFYTSNDTYVIYKGSEAAANLVKKKVLAVDLNSATFTPLKFEAHTGQGLYGTGYADEILNLTYAGRSRKVTVIGSTGFIKVE